MVTGVTGGGGLCGVFISCPSSFPPHTPGLYPWLRPSASSLDVSVTRVRKVIVFTSGLFPALLLLVMSVAVRQGGSFSLALFIYIMSLVFDGVHSSGTPVNPSDLMPAYAGALYGVANTIGTIPGEASLWGA